MINASLTGVSCSSTTSCMAVGWFQGSVPGTSAYEQQTLTESWNGTTWAVVHSPTPGPSSDGAVLNAVSCASSSNCMAVGDRLVTRTQTGGIYVVDKPLAEAWNGHKWSVVPTAKLAYIGASLNGVACLSSSSCIAVGNEGTVPKPYLLTLAEAWNGTAWKSVATPRPVTRGGTSLSAVSCASSTACMAVGYDGFNYGTGAEATLAEHWDGTAWDRLSTPTPNANGSLNGVTCVAVHACLAVGSHAGKGNRATGTLSEQWQGTGWKVQPTPDPATANFADLDSISCTGPTACMATGGGAAEEGESGLTVAQVWNGMTWRLLKSPAPGSYSDELFGVSCASASACVAVGQSQGTGDEHTLAEAWDGTHWQTAPTPHP